MLKKSIPWAVIALMFIVFFPVGIGLMIRKMTTEKYSYYNNGRSLRIFGWVLLAFGIIYLLMGLAGELNTEDGSSLVGGICIALVLFCGGGLFMILKGKQYINRGSRYSRYVTIVNTMTDSSIDNIAASFPSSYEQTLADLEEMLSAGYFRGAYINPDRRELIMPGQSQIPAGTSGPSAAVERRTVTCRSCGATNTMISRSSGECEYCGSPL